MDQEKLEKVENVLSKTSDLIRQIQEKRGSKMLTFFLWDNSLTSLEVYRLNKVLRKLGKVEKLDLLIESGGGDIDSAAKAIKLLRRYSDKLCVGVSFYAKSAASLFGIRADELYIIKPGELGPIEPMVRDPPTGMWVPAHSIKEALEFMEEIKDPYIKLSLADKLNPLLMGAFRDAQKASTQYVEEAFETLDEPQKETAIHTFTGRFRSHGYPINGKICKEVGINVVDLDADLEDKISSLHESYTDIVSEFDESLNQSLIIQTDSIANIVMAGEDITLQLEERKLEKKTESQTTA